MLVNEYDIIISVNSFFSVLSPTVKNIIIIIIIMTNIVHEKLLIEDTAKAESLGPVLAKQCHYHHHHYADADNHYADHDDDDIMLKMIGIDQTFVRCPNKCLNG